MKTVHQNSNQQWRPYQTLQNSNGPIKYLIHNNKHLEKKKGFTPKVSISPQSAHLIKPQKLRFNMSETHNSAKLTNLQILSITLMKIIVKQQVFQLGFSPLKIQILKLINQMQQEQLRQSKKDNSKKKKSTTLKQMKTFIICGVKMISKIVIEKSSKSVIFSKERTSDEQEDILATINSGVVKYFREFSLCLHFVVEFLIMLLKLVHFFGQQSDLSELNSKQAFFILCDYLGCQIVQNSSGFVINQEFFIKQYANNFSHGYLLKSESKKKVKPKRTVTEDSQNDDDSIVCLPKSNGRYTTTKILSKKSHQEISSSQQWKYYTIQKNKYKQQPYKFLSNRDSGSMKKYQANVTQSKQGLNNKNHIEFKGNQQKNDQQINATFSENNFLYSTLEPQRVTFSKNINLQKGKLLQASSAKRKQVQMPFLCYNCGQKKNLSLTQCVFTIKIDSHIIS